MKAKTRIHWSKKLEKYKPCSEGMAWAKDQKSAAVAWKTCARPGWMLWLIGRASTSNDLALRKRLVLCACECARTSLRFVRSGEERPLKAIETAERWARGEASIEEVREARFAAYAAAYVADAAAYAAAAYAAAYAAAAAAAYVAAAAAYVAAYAAYAADAAAAAAAAAYAADADYAAADYAAYAADDAARSKTLSQCADIVRKFYPELPQ